HLHGVQGVAGSNPVNPTTFNRCKLKSLRRFFIFRHIEIIAVHLPLNIMGMWVFLSMSPRQCGKIRKRRKARGIVVFCPFGVSA
ncbi:MAG: hypothetical protein KBE69_09020, partial [Akkermansia sp.]|nr:hypothetical protein [Akkermansia sp.]